MKEAAMMTQFKSSELSIETQGFYRHAVQLLHDAEVPFLVGGAYGLAHHAGIIRHTKDFDVFVHPNDVQRALKAFSGTSYHTELTFSHWLGKIYNGQDFIDIIFSSGNGVAKVDDLWFEHARPAHFLGEPILVCPPEESIWSKAFICERERFDGADINHLILTCGRRFDWPRLLWRFNSHWRILLTHLVLFGFTYPSERGIIPVEVMEELQRRLRDESASDTPKRRVCQGTLLSRTQYVVDLDQWGFADARLDQGADLTPAQAEVWTRAGLQQN